MEEAVDEVKNMLHNNFKRKHSESSEIGKSPKSILGSNQMKSKQIKSNLKSAMYI